MPLPAQFTTADGSLTGAVNGANTAFSFVPYPLTLLYTAPPPSFTFVFKNGVLLTLDVGYTAGRGCFSLPSLLSSDTVTAELYQGAGPTLLTLANGGITANGTTSFWLTPQSAPSPAVPFHFLLFNNGVLLTAGMNYTILNQWVLGSVSAGSAALPNTGEPNTFFPGFGPGATIPSITNFAGLVAVIGMGGITASTFDKTISGSTNNLNKTFVVQVPFTSLMLFADGLFLTAGVDYTVNGQQLTLTKPPAQVVTAQIFNGSAPVQVTNQDGSLFYSTASTVIGFRNGILMTQSLDGHVAGNGFVLNPAQTPLAGDVVTVETWTTDRADPLSQFLTPNLPVAFSSNDGSIVGAINGTNNAFTLSTQDLVTDMLITWNGVGLTENIDYTWLCSQASSAGPWSTTIKLLVPPVPDDIVTAEVFFA